jgi:hypothetical protein
VQSQRAASRRDHLDLGLEMASVAKHLTQSAKHGPAVRVWRVHANAVTLDVQPILYGADQLGSFFV